MEHLLVLREKYGSMYATELSSGIVVPWKPLSIGEFLEYEQEFRRGLIPPAHLENEIFKKCVLDQYMVDHPPTIAGDITTIVSGIMLVSGPSSLKEMQDLFMMKRLEASGIIHQIVSVITRAYPGYIPEQVYNLDYQSLMLRFAQAENKLLEVGILTQPLSLMPLSATQNQQDRQQYGPQDMRRIYNEQQGFAPAPPVNPMDRTVVSRGEMVGNSAMGADMEDRAMLETKMLNEAQNIYKDYVEQIKQGQDVRIKTPGEREAEARARMKGNQAQAEILMAGKKKKEQAYEAKVAKMLEARARRKRRR